MKKAKVLLMFMLITYLAGAQSKVEVAIKNILHQQTLAWNRGDIENFMNPYWRNDSLMFIGKSGITYGWQNTLK